MTRRAGCYDNAVMERFFGTLKTELNYRSAWTSRESVRSVIHESIEMFYNRCRRHSRLGCVCPAEFEDNFNATPAASPPGVHQTGGRSLPNWGAHYPEPEARVSLARECPSAIRRPTGSRDIVHAAAPEDPIEAAGSIRGNIRIRYATPRVVGISIPTVEAPLPYVPVHIVQSPRVRRVTPNRQSCPGIADTVGVGAEVEVRLSANQRRSVVELRRCPGSAAILPLSLRRQAVLVTRWQPTSS